MRTAGLLRSPVILLIGATAALISAQARALSEPVGVWSCVVFGDSGREEERLNLILAPNSATYISQPMRARGYLWRRLGDWERRRGNVSFADAVAGRIYTADLDYTTLGGTWVRSPRRGGWWCAAETSEPIPVDQPPNNSTPVVNVPPLIPVRMASPRYPREAIQKAIEGSAIVCFLVDKAGEIHEPQIMEISDDVFEPTTLGAVRRSRYRETRYSGEFRAGCRSYQYTLELIEQ